MTRDEDVVTREPLNVETAWDALATPITPVDGFYTRNNFAIPQIAASAWRLELRGFSRTFGLSYRDLLGRTAQSLDVVLECAGNNRTFFDPKPAGTAWRERAVGCARFTGTPLHELLDDAGVPPGTAEISFRGADQGREVFERSLPVRDARESGALLVWEMNGEPLQPRHGAPVRLVVPGWYGVASVKWLVDVRALKRPFTGHFQRERYVYQKSATDPAPVPVREKRVNSLIASPTPGASVAAGEPTHVRGWAWSGAGAIARVEVSTDGGATWQDATLSAQKERHAWRAFSHAWTPRAGAATLLSRATDAAGNTQPASPEWNVHGYGYNAPRPRAVDVR